MLERIYDSKERDYDNDGLDPSEEYFRKKKKDDDIFPSRRIRTTTLLTSDLEESTNTIYRHRRIP